MTAGRPRIIDKKFCDNCNALSTYIDKKNLEHWYYHEGKKYCKKCENKLFTNPKWHPKRMWYKAKIVLLKENPRKGICFNCGKEPKRTEIHHMEYHDEDPLKDAIELCDHCHGLTKDVGKRRK